MDEGVYERLIDRALREELERLSHDTHTSPVVTAEQPDVFARYLAHEAASRFRRLSTDAERLSLLNRLLDQLDSDAPQVPNPASHLVRIGPTERSGPGDRRRLWPTQPTTTPLSNAALLTNARHEPQLADELRSELPSVDRLDLVCAFVRWPGVRALARELTLLAEHEVPFRVLTTVYTGSTERLALDRLVRDFGAEVKISYDVSRTRLHAKAWLLRRRSGFHTAFVGSSNLTHSAITEGMEWNVRLSQPSTPALIAKFAATFDTYWEDPAFLSYDPDRDAGLLDEALRRGGQLDSVTQPVSVSLAGLGMRPLPHQEVVLDQLEAERVVHGHHRNLVVAATGTGKTVMAAFDYLRMCRESERPSLLFVAHQEQLLHQARRTYAEVLGDPTFGELMVGGARPREWRHVFASVQSLNSYGPDRVPPDAFSVVVVDEFHHSEAATYRRLLEVLRPDELLGLTATPERADGTDVRAYFGGRTAAEIRLWDAINEGLLCPFQYYALSDGVDLSAVRWTANGYATRELSELYRASEARSRIILSALDRYVDVAPMKGLGFCVDIEHARHMAQTFNDAGVAAVTVSSASDSMPRSEAVDMLRQGEVSVIFTVDIFNEGVDIPEVNTVLFLRPTESATVFIQQLGRGLRTCVGKSVLTVLDFVGHQRREFSFAQRLAALSGTAKPNLREAATHGFSDLPAGCQISLDAGVQEAVLENLRAQVTSASGLARTLATEEPATLRETLAHHNLHLVDVIRHRSWLDVRFAAGWESRPPTAAEKDLLNRRTVFTSVDDIERLAAYRDFLSKPVPPVEDMDPRQQHLARMLFFSLWPAKNAQPSFDAGFDALHELPRVRHEFLQILDVAEERIRATTQPLGVGWEWCPLRIHGRYTREELLAGLGHATLERPPGQMREGVAWIAERQIDALLITTLKTEAHYSPTTLYRDYAVSPTRFHWESQSGTSPASATGQRYIHHEERGSTVLPFVRVHRQNEFGRGNAYMLLGPARFHSTEGSRPMQILWDLDVAMPEAMFLETASAH